MDPYEELKECERKIHKLYEEMETVFRTRSHDEALLTLHKEKETLLKERRDNWEKLIIATAKGDEDLECMDFSEADEDWIKSVTGINTEHRTWNSFNIDSSIVPSNSFERRFKQIRRVFDVESEAGRRMYLDLFLMDILDRPEFDRRLRIFPDLEMSITRVIGSHKWRKLGGTLDYTIGFGKDYRGGDLDPFGGKTPYRELHFVAMVANPIWNEEENNIWGCVAQAATLYRSKKDAGKEKFSVWGVITNAKSWTFIHIDEAGLLWKCDPIILGIPEYQVNEVLLIYRLLHFILKNCDDSISAQVPGSAKYNVIDD